MNRLLWLILLIVWILFGSWCCWTKICGAGGAVASGDGCAVWKIQDKDRFSHDAESNIKFLKSSDDFISETEVDNALDAVSDYLKNNNSRVLTIVGYYSNSESNSNSAFSNLGESRADDIKQHFIQAGVDNKQLKTAGVEYNENCYDGNTLQRGARFMFGS